jgi:uncharacterized membrane protein YkoI
MNLKSILHRSWITAIVITLGLARAEAAPAVSADQAKKIALARVPGTVMHTKLKKVENKKSKKKAGGQHDHYYIKIQPKDAPKKWKRVDVDAVTGAVLEVKEVKAKSYD